ncbi:flavodoxin family protein [bacterium]|nr:flavodoxin family protein [bacterium]MBU1754068.1 flavodoxin family protein [bacterium]
MAKILVTYFSQGGNTEKLAKAVAKGAKDEGCEVSLKAVTEVVNGDLTEADGIIVGSPVYFGSMSAEVKRMFDVSVSVRRQLKDKIGAAFTTAGHQTGGKETTILSILQAMLIHQMIIVGDPLTAGGHYGTACVGKPNDKELQEAEALGKRVAEIVKKIWC